MTDASGIDDTSDQGGLGTDGTIPDEPGSVGVGAGEATTFEPEEDPEAASNRDPDAPGDGADPDSDAHSDTDD
ncbi:hypothetical protein [Agromyces sp. NPDC049794]|uniref:hypothetical protein n=1 Tax=unclassified Agromyces TaxID=2639701 RepID=UPI00340771BB